MEASYPRTTRPRSSVPLAGQPSLLARLTGPQGLRDLDEADLPSLAEEIRAFLVAKVCATGGHLGVNLGVVELTIALHRVFQSPRDVIIFDTGHQAYVHKILTGRQAGFDQLRQARGLSGYPSRTESEHDWVANSHASTALSYADGIAKALQLRGQLRPAAGRVSGQDSGSRRVVAVIGDGALTGGLAWEGLNNLGAAPDRPVVVVLNDNGRSYSPTVGGLARHLATLRRRHQRKGKARRAARQEAGNTVFDQLGFAYIGPVDGHDIVELQRALRQAAELGRPALVHAITSKGRGYAPAEADDADRMHGIGVLDPVTGRPPAADSNPSWTSVFGQEITDIGTRHPDVVAVTAAMLEPVGLKLFAERFPERVFDVGIAEQHAVCHSAGLAMAGLHPVVCVYATFLNRAIDQVLMDVALHQLGVTIVLDRAGITGPDGASHHGMWDIAILRSVPGLRLAAPRDAARLRELLHEAVAINDRPSVVRFPKASAGSGIDALARMDGMDILHRGSRLPLDVMIVAAGAMADACVQAANLLNTRGIGVTVIDPRWILPVNPALVHLADRHHQVITVEDGIRTGGVGTALALACADAGVRTPVRALGLPPGFLDAGDRGQLLAEQGLTGPGIAEATSQALRTHASNSPAAA